MAEVITVIVLIGMAICFYKGLEFVAKHLRKMTDKIRGISPDKREQLDEEKGIKVETDKLHNAQTKEQLANRRKEIEERLEKSQFGKTFEAWAGLAWFVFVIFILVKLIGYFDASDKRMESLWKSNGYYKDN